ncbi:TIGR04283 family arsenosugar biosynthesis glycosyltransferase [Thiocapsa marina]|uniref:Glycosyl transferase family 2 n=1 Tax=Thiocapsa marina 5811 TaxID=768671 RepID=F9UID1_9GAMM|nr:TIGR04283 family arsenosugar biosynthesis glycosyltransferase [Thiocapsa marina]EGV16019.1 glycosyl transferase family 2 [Thiocapsa marina 5811]
MQSLSIIIPTRRIEAHLKPCLDACRRSFPAAEIIVVVARSEAHPLRSAELRELPEGATQVLVATPGRGPQCNAGARAASGELLLFLHDDSILPPEAAALTLSAFAADDAELACFRLRFDDAHWLLGVYGWFSRFDSLLTSFGDQGILIRRRVFDQLGGFPDWPLFEDVELLRRGRRRGRVLKLPGVMTTSAVRFRRNGVVRQQLTNAGLILRYLLGATPTRLAELYEQGRR